MLEHIAELIKRSKYYSLIETTMKKNVQGICVDVREASFTANSGKDKGKEIVRYYHDFLLENGEYITVTSLQKKYEPVEIEEWSAELAKPLALDGMVANGKRIWRFA